MSQTHSINRTPGATYAISNTGPLISAFQSDSFSLLTQIFAQVHIPDGCKVELIKHGWQLELDAAQDKLIIVVLTTNERERAIAFATQIAKSSESIDQMVKSHLAEAEAIALALRPEYQSDLLLLDEQAARSVAKRQGIKLSGFPGVLLLAVHTGLISPDDLKTRLDKCRELGTHYGLAFIDQVYDMAKWGGNKI